MDVTKVQPTSTPFGHDNKPQHQQEVETNAAFKALDAADTAPDAPGDVHTISRQAVAANAATALGISQDAVDAALRQTNADSFNMDQFSSLVGNLQPAPTDPATGPVLSKGGHNDPAQVKVLQAQLKGLGLYEGEIDGKFGGKTEAAVKAYQTSVGHVDADGNADGKAGPITSAAIQKEFLAKAAIGTKQAHEDWVADHPEAQDPANDATIQEATVDNAAFQDAIKDAGGDKAKLQQLADSLPTTDARADVLKAIVGGKLSDGVGDRLLEAMQDQERTFTDFSNALQASDGRPEDFKAVADLAEAKSKVNGQFPETVQQLKQLATTMRSMTEASPAVRQALAKGFDGRTNYGDYQTAVDGVSSQADVNALKSFVDYTNTAETAGGKQAQTFTQNEAGRLATIAQNYPALATNPSVWGQVKNAVRDNDWTGADLDNAIRSTTDPTLIAALVQLKKDSNA
ncbi:MAG: putative peptidoglycan binding domain [Cyanobacteria bacterium RYN_339]|nr:putative peptidoglycan binding domain [Cyanobacteria bacterium RYN_339]